ncbi:sulfite exporter TauE/SafE family protein [Actinomyces bouchesdurhonensis]|uniref:sulfite exporter TauE/SafE family protein n=1 Tax=Actinomyces bouchesdurhonensis TaxID=1852361 RepID=UPI0028E8E277|nr:sulfite exporter TauE/SafE family protein [Actinomyces bouchesdurhonensis]
MPDTDSQRITVSRVLLVIATGVGAGFLSGLFGVGGGLVIVPALMAVLGMDQRRASATSLAAIIVTAAVGSGTYALHGEVSWAGAALLALGALVGSQIGVWLLRRLPAPALPWILIGFTLFVIVSQYLHVPTREGAVLLTPASCVLLILVGLCAGILSGLVGVGGGSFIVPGMELAVGAGDLIARGTSLLVMIPTGIAGTVTYLRHRMVDLRVGLIVGASAAATAPVGRLVATLVSPSVGAILFNIFLLSIIASTILKMRRKARAQR